MPTDIQYTPPSQIQASNPDDAKVLHLAQTIYGEFAGVKDKKLQQDYMTMGASSAVNTFGKREWKNDDWDTNLYKRFDAVKGMNEPYKQALSGKFEDPQSQYSWKKAMQVAFGVMNGHIQNDGTQFYHTPDERKAQEANKAFDYSQVNDLGTTGQYERYSYKQTDSEKVQEKLSSLGYYKGNIDGDLGPISQAAIARYQQDNGLTVDGIAGKNTKAKLLAKSE